MINIDDRVIGQAIMKMRKKQGLKQKELNEQMGMGRSWLSDVERGKQTITFNDVIKLCELMDVDIDELSEYIINRSK